MSDPDHRKWFIRQIIAARKRGAQKNCAAPSGGRPDARGAHGNSSRRKSRARRPVVQQPGQSGAFETVTRDL